jgi:uncharacterized protein MJ0359
MNEITIKGYHGTNSNNCRNILNSNYRKSKGDKEWLGDGVYFFIEGISSESPRELAKKWVIAESSKRKHKDYAVIESEIKVNEEKFLDLTTKEGVKILFYFAEQFIEEIKKEIAKGQKGLKFLDGFLINLMRGENVLPPTDVIKGNFYIKFEQERKNKINFRTNNCTICAVYNPEKNIIKKSNKIVDKGEIL